MKLLMLVTSGVTASSSTSSRFSGNCMAEPQAGNVIINEQSVELKKQMGGLHFFLLLYKRFVCNAWDSKDSVHL